MYQKVKAYVKRFDMLKKQDIVIAGVSGGADSICLLFMLLEMKREIDFSIVVVHVHHGIRGESADDDEQYVKRICKEQGVELLCFHENVREYAYKHGISEEEAGRDIRRNIFHKVMIERKGNKVALAHHKNDNAETFLWNLCRGTGLKGLGGILPVSGEYIRPLLCLKRDEIEEYLKRKNITYCMDETNDQDNYTRNRIRNHVIPYLEEQINEETVNHISRTIENIRLFNEYIAKEVEKYVKSCVDFQSGKYIINKKQYENIPEVFRGNVIYESIAMLAGKKKDIEAIHVQNIKDLFNKQTGRSICLPYKIKAIRSYEGVELICSNEEMEKNTEGIMPNVKMNVFARPTEMMTFPEKNYTKWFDYDIIKRTVKIRHRESGDYIVIDKNGRTQKLKQYFINEKIPQNIRDQIWLVADGHEIMWIVGYRQSIGYQITDKTTKIMEISFDGRDMKEAQKEQ